MKNIIKSIIIISIIAIAITFTFSVYADNARAVAQITYNFDNSTGTLTIYGEGDMPSYQYNSNAPWNYNVVISNVKSIVVSEGITSIGEYAFDGFKSLVNVTIPSTVTKIGMSAFQDCTSLQSITIPENVTAIGGYAFDGCTSLTDINLPLGIKEIGGNVLSNCTSLVEIEIPESVKYVQDYMFEGCTSLKNVTLPDTITWVGYYAFKNCKSLENIIFYDGLTRIYSYAFEGCSTLTTITIPGSATDISSYSSFNGCTALKTVHFTLTNSNWSKPYIDPSSPLRNAEQIKHYITKHDAQEATCTQIGWKKYITCSDCDYSTYIEISATGHDVTSHEYQAPTCTEHGWESYENCSRCDYSTYVEIPATGHSKLAFTSVNDTKYPFKKVDGINGKDNVFASTNHSDKSNAAYKLTALYDLEVAIYYSTSSESYDRLVVKKNSSQVFEASGSTSWSKRTISLKKGDILTFTYSKDNVQSKLQDTVWFYIDITNDENIKPDCTNPVKCEICDFTIEEALGHDEIVHNAQAPTCTEYGWDEYVTCSRCSYTTYKKLSATGHNYVDKYCTACGELEIIASGKLGSLNWKFDVDGILTITAPENSTVSMTSYTSSSSYPWYSYRNDIVGVVIGEGVSSIGYQAFYSFGALETVVLSESVKSIDSYAFAYCSILSDIDLSDVVSIGDYSFVHCYALTKLDLSSASKLGSCAFLDCTAAKEILLSKNLTMINTFVFSGCESIATITIPENVTRIGNYAFSHCLSLKSMIIYPALRVIGDNAFYNTNSLNSLYIVGSTLTVGDKVFDSVGVNNSVLTGIAIYDLCANLEHNIISHNKKLPSCTEVGWEAYEECLDCDYTTYKEISELGHDEIAHVAQDPTCTEIGWHAYITCSRCDHTTYTEIAFLGHSFSDWYITKDVTCTTDGLEERKCSVCEETEINTIFAEGHKYKAEVIAPTCTTLGYTVHTCVCGDKYTDSYVFYADHDLDENGDCKNCTYPENGFYTVDGKLYYRINNKNVTGWFVVEGRIYYASSATNVVINYSKKISGKYYVWSDETGLKIADGFVDDGIGIKCYDNGVQVIGWRHKDGSGPKVVGGISEQYSQNPEGLYYFLSTTGYMVTSDTYKLGGYIREFNTDHTVKAMNGLQTQGGELYYYVDGVKQTGWHTINGTTYYFRASDAVYGRAATKWMYIGNKVYYFYASTSGTSYALKNEGSIGGIKYTYHEEGYVLYNGFVNCEYANVANSNTAINIQKKNATTRYYKDGEMQTGWQEIGGEMYYFYAIGSSMGSGYMCVQSRTIGGVWYEFAEDGRCINYICVKNGHAWVEANCSSPKTCLRCGKNEGDVQHSFEDRTCTLCGYMLPSEGLSFKHHINQESYYVSGIGTCTDSVVVIPSVYEGKPVTAVGSSAFYNCSTITEVVIPDSVNEISDTAFSRCKNLKSVKIPESVKSIGMSAFSQSTSLNSITIPYGLETIGILAFYSCSGLKNISIPESVTTIEDSAFSSCTSLLTLTIPESVEYIGDKAFSNCSSMQTIVLPEKVTSLGSYLFANCRSLISVDLPQGTTAIGEQMFYNCYKLTSVKVPEGITSIGTSAFYSCESLKSFVIPYSVTSIGVDAFANCTSLEQISISKTVKSIENYAFNCCFKLSSIVIPEGVTSIGKGAFAQCSGLKYVTVSENNPVYFSKDNCIIETESKKLVVGTINSIIPDYVTAIGDYAFSGCLDLSAISIPDTVTSIGIGAFENCEKLESIVLPEGVTSIGDYAFYYCKKLNSINIPDSVNYIGNSVFTSCEYLTSISIPEGVTYIGQNLFSGCFKLANVTLPESVSVIGAYAFYNCYALTSINIPKSVTKIEDYTFTFCKNLTNIELHDGITYIGASAFYNCSKLTTIVIPMSVTGIGYYAFTDYTTQKVIYCEAESMPGTWSSYWLGSTNITVYWGNQWEYVDGVPTLK